MRFLTGYKKLTKVQELQQEISRVLCSSSYLEGKFYEVWVTLPEERRKKFLNQMYQVIRDTLLADKFLVALAKDIITSEGIKVESHLYQYLANSLYNGDSRKLLIKLQTALEKSKNGRKHNK